jgi:hypothetical protein
MADIFGRRKAIDEAVEGAEKGKPAPEKAPEVDRRPKQPGESAVDYYKRLKKAQSTDEGN